MAKKVRMMNSCQQYENVKMGVDLCIPKKQDYGRA